MRADLFTHPKVIRITSALKADRLRTVGGLMSVWCLFDAHSVDGTLDGYTLEALDDLVGWQGFSAAMVAVGWLINNGESLSTPRFDEHNGQSAKRRAQETERKRAARAEPQVSAHDADKLRSREEKRREETEANASVVADKPPRAARKCPKGFEPEEPESFVAANVPGVDWRRETEAFRDHTFRNAITDWQGCWRNWMRKAKPSSGGASKTSFTRDREAQASAWMGSAAPQSGEIIDMEQSNVTRLALG